MRRKNIMILSMILLFSMFPVTVYANSSWHWVTYSPKDILPFAILFTLLIETFGIKKFGKVNHIKEVIFVVAVANIISFTFPYIYRAYNLMGVTASNYLQAWTSAFNSGPYYMIMLGYLALTLLLEMPVVYNALKNISLN